uniref:Testis expressed 22 n=1 Tax=Sus scrofa TaxID=9823 RepID=A0A8D1QIN6_PIG
MQKRKSRPPRWGKKPESWLPEANGQPSAPPSPAMAWGQPSAQSGSQQVLQTQDWVCEPQESSYPSRRWSLSIDQRRRQPSPQDLSQIVAQLVSEDVDKDVLLPHPPRTAESTKAFQAALVRSAPFRHNVTLEAQASRSRPS